MIVLGGGVIGCEFASVWKSLRRRGHHRRGAPPAGRRRGRGVVQGARARLPQAQDRLPHRHAVPERQDHRRRRRRHRRGRRRDRGRAAAGRGRPRPDHRRPRVRRAGRRDGPRLRARRRAAAAPTSTGVYAVGDIVPGLQLAHRGFQQGIFVAEDIAGLDPQPIDEAGIPRVTYSHPEVASVGLDEAAAAEKYGADGIETLTYDLGGNGKSQILKTQGFVKLVRRKDGPVVGVHMVGDRVGELIGEAQLIYNWEAYAEDVAPLVHAHPTQNEALGEAHLALAGKPLHAHS